MADPRSGRPTVVTVAAALMLLQVVVGLVGGGVNAATADGWLGTPVPQQPGMSAEVQAGFDAVLSVVARAVQLFVGLAAVANASTWGISAWATRDGQAWPRAVATILAALAASSAVTLPLVALVSGSAPGYAGPLPQYSPWTFVVAGVTALVTIAAAALLWTRPARAFVEAVRLSR